MATAFDTAAAALPPGTTVLQVGAFDGQTNDPVLAQLRDRGWHGVLVEPQPGPYEAVRALHADNPRVQVLNVAVGDRDGTRELFTLDPVDDLPGWAQQIASFKREHLVGQQAYLPEGIVAERLTVLEVETLTFSTLLARAGVERVDVLQIDTEGWDWEALQLFDVPRRRPAMVHYEHLHLSEADQAAAQEMLRRNGYVLTVEHWDTCAVLTP